MARTYQRQLNRFQRRHLRNPLRDIQKPNAQADSRMQRAAQAVTAALASLNSENPVEQQIAQFMGDKRAKIEAILAAQGTPAATTDKSPAEVAFILVGLDDNKPGRQAADLPGGPEAQATRARQILADAITALGSESQPRQRGQSRSVTLPTDREERDEALAALVQQPSQRASSSIRAVAKQLRATDLDVLRAAEEAYEGRGSTSGTRRTTIERLLNELSSSRAAQSVPPPADAVVDGIQLDIDEDQDEDDEDDDDDDEEEEGDQGEEEESTSRGRSTPRGSPASDYWDPDSIQAARNLFSMERDKTKVPGGVQRSQARKKRLQGLLSGDASFKKFMLPYRRPQSRNRSDDLSAPVLYSPPADVMAKIDEIMATRRYTTNRENMPTQFQDVLVYVLTKNIPLGRKIIPRGSVEVYNKGTLVGTFGGQTPLRNYKQALYYAASLVGADITAAKQVPRYERYKQSRMHSRVLSATQGEDGYRLVAPSLQEVLQKDVITLETEVDDQEGFGEEYDEFQESFEYYSDDDDDGGRVASNPRRLRFRRNGRRRNRRRDRMYRRIGDVEYTPTINGYRVTSGPKAGQHYTVNEYGHGCKIAMLLDVL